ncbi:hypothetical protein FH972_003188 [Carpinus fangiana]|uniref:RING-type E3 ubiquitin transferase n=1 Tax=Carpinus fangiana TaxID=176857 RepID=A0A5N6QJ45_9ROSI|nr:hypothetical protein FH972_003188 [Carpinus fangiana]
MAAISSESNTNSSNYPIDMLFDLDQALTLPEDISGRPIAAPKSVVMNMPTVAATDHVCSVCVESFRSGEGGKQVPCGHVYHAACIASWLSHNNSCPLCRSKISGD